MVIRAVTKAKTRNLVWGGAVPLNTRISYTTGWDAADNS